MTLAQEKRRWASPSPPWALLGTSLTLRTLQKEIPAPLGLLAVVSVWTWKMPVARTLQLPYYEKVRPGDCARPTQGGTRADNVHEGPKRDGAHA